MTPCPPAESWEKLLAGEVAGAEQTALEDHLGTCQSCQDRFAKLTDPGETFKFVVQSPDPRSAAARPAFLDRIAQAGPDTPSLSGVVRLASAPPVPDLPGYVILTEVGRGGMGVVYKACQVNLNRVVAVKMILAGLHASPSDRARFKKEAEAVGRLHHPNVVGVYEVGERDGLPYMALEYVHGGNLARKLAGTPLPTREAAELIEQLGRGVQAAHVAGIVHRDLKPGNVLLATDGTPKIADFGLAKTLDPAATQGTDTLIAGTPSYMAPEQAAGDAKQIGPTADVYALGAILYECLTGRPPFKAESPVETMIQVMHAEPVPPRQLQPKVPRDVETICLKCLRKDPRKRYPSAGALADDLRRWLDGRPITARPVGRVERAWKAARRHPVETLLGTAVVTAVLAGLALVGWQWREAEAARERAESARWEADSNARFARAEQEKAEANEQAAEAARRTAARKAARLAFEQGRAWCEQGDVSVGLRYLADGLTVAEQAGDPDLTAAARANLSAWLAEAPARPRELNHAALLPLPPEKRSGVHVLSAAVQRLPPQVGGPILAATGCSEGYVVLWDARTGQPVRPPLPMYFLSIPGIPASLHVKALAFSPDDRLLAVGCWDGAARVIEVHTGKTVRVLRHDRRDDPSRNIWSVAFTPDGGTLLTGGEDGQVARWSTETGQEVGPRLVLGTDQDVYAIAVAPDGRRAAAGGRHGRVVVWALPGGAVEREFTTHDPGGCHALAFLPDGDRLLVGGEWSAQEYRAAAELLSRPDPRTPPLWVPKAPAFEHTHRVDAVRYAAGGRVFLTAGHDGAVRLWDGPTGRRLWGALPHSYQLRDAEFVRDPARGRLAVLTAGQDGAARLWDLPPGRAAGQTWETTRPVVDLGHLPDGRLVATNYAGARVGANPRAPDRTLTPPHQKDDHAVWSAAVSPDGRVVAVSRHWGREVWLMDPGTGAVAGKLAAPGRVSRLLFAPAGRDLIALTEYSDGPRPAVWWRWEGDAPVARKWDPPSGATAASFTPDGRRVAIGFPDGAVKLWDADTGRPTSAAVTAPAGVTAVAYSPDGRAIAVGCATGAVRTFDAELRETGVPVETGEPVQGVTYAPDGKTVLVAGGFGAARYWDPATGLPIGPALWHRGRVTRAVVAPDGLSVVTGGDDGVVRRWPALPAPWTGTPEEATRAVSGIPQADQVPR